jgi:radical SAM-linked protein
LFSEGFHPHPKISFPCATQVGIESLCEYADIQIRDNEEDIEGLAERISSFLPAGIDILDIEEIPIIDKPLSGIIAGFYYEIFPFRKVVGSRYDDCKDRIKKFLETDSFTISRDIKGKHTERNIRPLVGSLSFDEGNCRIDMFLRFNSGGGVRPSEILTQVMGFGEEDALNARIVKTKTIFQKEPICRKE